MKFSKLLVSSLPLFSFFITTSSLCQTNAVMEKTIDSLLQKMTLEEKMNMIHANSAFTSGGIPRLGIPELTMSDGPHGVRPEQGRYWVQTEAVLDSGTYLPTGVCLGATWNAQLGYAFGTVLGSEANFRKKDVILGPGINVMRTPLNGRNFEYLSEDPYLIATMAVGYVEGVQSQGISACVKHYAANNQEIGRNWVNVEMSERALREIYLPGFEAAVTKAHVNTLMSAYNKFRGQFCSENDYLLNKILKEEWKFDGAVISDWGAVHHTKEALLNGCDIEMGTDLSMLPKPDYHKFYMADAALKMVQSEEVPELVIDDKVRRILRVMYKTGMLNGTRPAGAYNTKEHQQTALKIAEEGIVLLKNENNILPLKKASIKSVAVIGYNAARKQSMGGGSSQVKAFYEITPLEGLQKMLGNNVQLTYAQGYKIEKGAGADSALIDEAVQAASKADIAIIVGGWTHGYNYKAWGDNAYDAESVDKPNLEMPFGQNELIKAVLKANPKTIVVLIGGGPINVTQWLSQTPALLQAWYPGMEGGTALAEILFGKINPSGKLPMTWPVKLEDCPAHKLGEYPFKGRNVHYNDDIYVGYRYYDTYKVTPLFAFGYGLSYTNFSYKNLSVQPAGNKTWQAKFTLTNNGKISGAEVVQLYVHQQHSSLPRPEKELKGFEKVFLQPGETKTITISLTERAFQYYDDSKKMWIAEPGLYDILVGSSSAQILLKQQITLPEN